MPSITNAPNVTTGDLVGYQYVVLRVVPRAEREEFLNAGIVLFAQGVDFLDAGYVLDRARLRALAPDLDLAMVEDALTTVRSVCRGVNGQGLPALETLGQRFGWLSAPRSTVVQPSPRHGGVCADPEAELHKLVTMLVVGVP